MNTAELNDYILNRYAVEAEHPFKTDSRIIVFRHAHNRKWFALTMYVPYSVLGLDETGEAYILNLKCDPVVAGSIKDGRAFFPAYHMNKTNWITVLPEAANEDEIAALMQMSYELTNSAAKARSEKRNSSKRSKI